MSETRLTSPPRAPGPGDGDLGESVSLAAKEHSRAGVLIVADDPAIVSELESILAGLDLSLAVVKSGREALDGLSNGEFAVIIMATPIDALETAERIRTAERTELTPILFLAGENGAIDESRVRSLTFVDQISGPLDPVLLRTKVGAYVDLHQKTELMRQQAAHRMQLAREQVARQVAESAMRRSALLAEASRLLSRSLDFNDTLSSLHRALVPSLADACQLVLSDQNGELWYANIEDSTPKKASTSGSHARIQKVDAELGALVRDAINSRHTRVIDGQVIAGAPALGRESGWTSAIVAPLIARDSPIGAVIGCRRGARRPFAEADSALIEDLAGRAATALDNAQLFQAIRDGERRKDEFLAMLGHELRNPLAAITNAGELTRLISPSDPSFQETLEIIRQQAALMKRLVDDLLDVSRITSGRVQLQKATVCAGAIVARVAEANASLFTSRSQVLHLSVPKEEIYLDADTCRLEQILSNLLVNASKYTDPGGQIWFGVSRDGSDALFRVKDSGIGIGPDLLPHVFDLFSQANRSLHRSEGGLGIGLTIVKGLTDLHGGRVWATSDGVGRGSQFCVWLPANPAPAAPTSRQSTGGGQTPILPARKRRVLVVEDQPALLHVTVALLKRLGHEVHAAADGAEALLAVKEYRPEVVFLDIGLPGMNGYDVARSIRQELAHEAPVLVAMTGYGQQEVDKHSARAKFDCHLVKPVDVNAMQKLFGQMSDSSA